MSQLPPTIGPYQVLRRLGNGGMGEVFLAFDPRLERQVAIKRIDGEGDGDPARRARFRREARLAAGLNHPAIVQVFDLLSEGDDDYMVMEYVAGASLRKALNEGPLPLSRGLAIAVSIAEGLAYAHRQEIVHRDLKTENILLTSEGEAKIADFGIARRLLEEPGEESLTREGAVLGTYRTMAPEQASGGPSGPRSDLFSFGVLLYELFTGSSPFLAKTEAVTLQRILDPKHRPRPVSKLAPGLPQELSELIEQLLEKVSVFRPRDADEVLHRLRAIADGAEGEREVTAALPSTIRDGPVVTPARNAARQRWIIALIAAALCAGLPLALSMSVRNPEDLLLDAENEISHFASSQDPSQRQRAFELLENARAIAPNDPAVCITGAYVEMQAGDLDKAEVTLERCERLAGDDVRLLEVRANLAERRGQPEEALKLRREAAKREPRPHRWYEYAKLARRQGKIETARAALRSLFELTPSHEYGRQLLALLELTNGDPGRAAELYEELAADATDYPVLVNLGLSRMLLHDYDGAGEALQQAVDAAPLNAEYCLYLANALWLQGRQEDAKRYYRSVLFTEDEPGAQKWKLPMFHAQAHAHLGQRDVAITEVQEAYGLAPEKSGEAAYEASLVYVLVGETAPALEHATKALEEGWSRSWFQLPWFDAIREDPDFRSLLQDGKSTAAREPTAVRK